MCLRDVDRAKGTHPNNSSESISAAAQEKHSERGGSQREGGQPAPARGMRSVGVEWALAG
jgi:hypothetical protein